MQSERRATKKGAEAPSFVSDGTKLERRRLDEHFLFGNAVFERLLEPLRTAAGTRPGAFAEGIGILRGLDVAATLVLMLTQVSKRNAVFLHRDENFVDELGANGFGFVLETFHLFVDFLQADGIFKSHVVNLN